MLVCLFFPAISRSLRAEPAPATAAVPKASQDNQQRTPRSRCLGPPCSHQRVSELSRRLQGARFCSEQPWLRVFPCAQSGCASRQRTGAQGKHSAGNSRCAGSSPERAQPGWGSGRAGGPAPRGTPLPGCEVLRGGSDEEQCEGPLCPGSPQTWGAPSPQREGAGLPAGTEVMPGQPHLPPYSPPAPAWPQGGEGRGSRAKLGWGLCRVGPRHVPNLSGFGHLLHPITGCRSPWAPWQLFPQLKSRACGDGRGSFSVPRSTPPCLLPDSPWQVLGLLSAPGSGCQQP